MALASDRLTQPIPLSFEDFLAQYGNDDRYDRQILRGDQPIVSAVFPKLNLIKPNTGQR